MLRLVFLASAFAAIFITVNPFSKVPFFLILTQGFSRKERHQVIINAVKVSLPVLLLFALIGKFIFMAFGVEFLALKIFGGIILLKIGWDMLRGQMTKFKGSIEEEMEAVDRAMVGVVPLAIPMIAGPGSIITVMVFVGQAQSIFEVVAILLFIIAVIFVAYFLLLESKHIVKRVGKIGIQTGMRIMGIIIASIGIQTLIERLIELSAYF